MAGIRPGGAVGTAEDGADGWQALERRLRAADDETGTTGRVDPIRRPRRRRPLRGERWKVAAAILAAAVLVTSLWIVERRVTGGAAGRLTPETPAGAPGPFPLAERPPSVTAAEIPPPLAGEPSGFEDEPCASAEDCGPGGRRIWPAFPL